MFYNFILNYVEAFTFLNVFKYITFRAGLAFFSSFIIVLIIGGPFIKLFSDKKILNPIRMDGPQDHLIKKIGTPTMGGLLILIGLIVSVLLWSDLSNIYILFCLYIVISFGLLGALDDFKKIKNNNSSGISFRLKLFSQIFLAFIGISFLTYYVNYQELKKISLLKPTLKKYLYGFTKSEFRIIKPDDFVVAALLPVHNFKKAPASKVWADSRSMI